jgi:putative addiction module component (TIGR02574 family)
MVAKQLLDDVLALPAEDQLELVQQVWDSLANRGDIPLSDDQKRELDFRYEEYLRNPTEGETWEEVEAYLDAQANS